MVRQVVGVQGAQALVDVTRGAWQDYIDEDRQRFHRATRAHIVWDYMVQRADAVLADMEGVARIKRHERPLYVLRQLIMIRPKLHTRETATRNYPTKAQLNVQATGLFPDHEDPNVMFGYKLDAAEAGIQQYVLTSPTDPWVIDLEELAAGELRPIAYMLDMPGLDAAWRNVEGIRFRDSR
jgi:hypothetical protein